MTEEPQPSLIERPDVRVMFRRAVDLQASITAAWTELEDAIGSLRGRKFYGVFDPSSSEYRACVELRDEDDPDALRLEVGTIPGGRYARVRLQGEPPKVYARIAPVFQQLADRPDCDPDRPEVEYYCRRDVIELLQPVI